MSQSIATSTIAVSSVPPTTQFITSTQILSNTDAGGSVNTEAVTVVQTSTRPGTTVYQITTRTFAQGADQQAAVIPLTTFFTPPADCNATSAYLQSADAASIHVNTTCYPQSWAQYQVSTNNFYSPGVCPWRYEWAIVSKVTVENGGVETRAWCCPSGLSRTANHDYTTYCYDEPTLGASGSGRFALPVSIAFREADLTSFQPPNAPITALNDIGFSVAISASTSSAAASSTGSLDTGSSGGGGLSTGAAAGTGVGVAVVAIAIIAALLWYFRRRRNQRLAREHEDGTRMAEAEDSLPKAEKDGNERFEAPGTSKPAEAEGKAIAELDGGWQAPEVDGTGSRPAG